MGEIMDTIWWTQTLLALGMMVAGSVWDMRERRIPLWLPGIVGAAALCLTLWQMARGETGWLALTVSLLPGAGLLLLSWGTRERIGRGDGLVVLAAGLCLGAAECVAALAAGLLLAAAGAAFLLVLKKANRQTRLPFLPFLTVGTGAVLWLANVR